MSFFCFPFVKLAFALIFGQCLFDICPDGCRFLLPWLVPLLLLGLLVLRLCLRSRAWYWQKWASVCLFVFVALLQMWRLALAPSSKDVFGENEHSFAVTLLAKPVEKPNSWQCQVRMLVERGRLYPWQEPPKLQLYLPKDSLSETLRTGDVLHLRCRLESLDEPLLVVSLPDSLSRSFRRIPEAFDYNTSLRRQGFVATAYVPAGHWRKDPHLQLFPFRRQMERLRERLVARYEKAGISGPQLALISALTLGQKNLMDDTQRESYAAAGVSHILAVSGMHVGIICQLLSSLLFWMRGHRVLFVVKYLILTVLLWVYACLTGFSASVLRAVIMFTVSALGICLQRRAYAWNSLGFAASIMLLFNPDYLYQLGFQLSFIAVVAILSLHPYFQKQFSLPENSGLQNMMTSSTPYNQGNESVAGSIPLRSGASQRNHPFHVSSFLRRLFQKTGSYGKDLFCLSLAAQIGTAPLSVYCFHEFPNYFWLSNLFLVPLSLLLTYLGVALLMLADLMPFGVALSALLNAALDAFMGIAAWISSLPWAQAKGLYPSFLEMVILYVSLFLFIRLSQSKWLHYQIDNIFRQIRNSAWHLNRS